jgi:hypothetical protein
MGLSAAQLLGVVDAGADADAAGRGRVLLAAAAPGESHASLSLGQRDTQVLALRCATFGDTLEARVDCPECGVRLTVRIPRDHLPASSEPQAVSMRAGPVSVTARAPDGAALEAAARCVDVVLARASLIHACVVATNADGAPVDPLTLDAAVLEQLGEALVAADPAVEMRVPMSCAKCGCEWAPVLDPVEFFWRELAATSVQLLDDVHELALGYGWSEPQVLELSSRRRREYVNRLAGG